MGSIEAKSGSTYVKHTIHKKIHPLCDAAFDEIILKIITIGLKMDSGNAIMNCYMF